MSGRKKDPIWQYFDEVKGDKWLRAKCKNCSKEMQGIVARMKSHWDSCENCVNNEQAMNDDEINNNQSEETQTRKHCLQLSHTESGSSKTSKAGISCSIKNFVSVTTTAQKKEFDKQIARYIYATNSSFNSVEHKEFKILIEKLKPGYTPPNRHNIADELLQTVHQEEQEKAQKSFENQTVCLSVDGWSNVRNEPIISACIVNKEGNICLVDTIDTSGNHHTAEYLQAIITETINKVQHNFKCKIGSIVTDNAPNMAKMRENILESFPDILVYGCSAHVLNLLAKDLEIPAATRHIVSIIKFFRNNQFAKAKLSQMNQSSSKLIIPIETRWNTMCDALQSYLDNWIHLVKICEEFKDDIESEIKKSVMNINMKRNAEDMLGILKPISIALTQCEANTCTIGDVVLIWKNLECQLNKILNSTQRTILKKRYNQIITSQHFVAFLLTPKYYCDTTLKLTENEKEQAFKYLKTCFGAPGLALTKKILCLPLKTSPFTGTLMDKNIMAEFDSLNWWKSLQAVKEILSKEEENIVTQHLTAISSSASIERVFSTFGYVHSKVRNALGVEKAAKLVFLHRQLNAS